MERQGQAGFLVGVAMVRMKSQGGLLKYHISLIFRRPTNTSRETIADKVNKGYRPLSQEWSTPVKLPVNKRTKQSLEHQSMQLSKPFRCCGDLLLMNNFEQ